MRVKVAPDPDRQRPYPPPTFEQVALNSLFRVASTFSSRSPATGPALRDTRLTRF